MDWVVEGQSSGTAGVAAGAAGVAAALGGGACGGLTALGL